MDRLSEDYPLICSALTDLESLEVLYPPSFFAKLRLENRTTQAISDIVTQSQSPGPVELENIYSRPEILLIDSLINIGAVEVRSEEKSICLTSSGLPQK